MNEILAAIWFFLPAGLANAAPVFAAKTPGLKQFKTPMDFEKSYKGQRLFGPHKTWRGLLAGVVAATLVIALQKYLFTRNLWVLEHSWFDYRTADIWLLGPLMGTGALLADAVKSHFKRRNHIAPGESWFPFDQLDYVLGGCLFSLAVVQLGFDKYLWVAGTWFGLHLCSVFIGYKLGIRDAPI